MNRIIIITLLITGIFTAGFGGGVKYMAGKYASEQLDATADLIKNDNQDKKEIAAHESKVNKSTSEATREIIKIKTITVTGDCPLPDLGRMRNETFAAFPADLFVQ